MAQKRQPKRIIRPVKDKDAATLPEKKEQEQPKKGYSHQKLKRRLRSALDPNLEELGPVPKPKEMPARLTVVEQVSYEVPNEKAVQIHSAYHRELKGKDQSYQRTLTASEQWQPVDLGWVKTPGEIVLSNEEGKNLMVIPTKEEQEQIARRVIEIKQPSAADKDCFLLHPGACLRVTMGGTSLLFRSPSGDAKCSVSVFPA